MLPKIEQTILDVLGAHAATRPDKAIFVFLKDGEEESGRLTVADLQRRVQTIAAHLSDICECGDRAILLYPPGLEFVSAFLGCLYAGVIAIPMYAPHPRRFDPRLASVAADSSPRIILSDRESINRCYNGLELQGALKGAPRIATDLLRTGSNVVSPLQRRSNIAFVQYTSGSTSEPKGVCVTHRNLMANQHMIQSAMRLDSDSVFVSWLPTHHDMGLVGDMLQTVYSGCVCVRMPPPAFLQYPRRWLAAITKYRATIVGSPNFGYELCAQRVSAPDCAGLDLSSLRVTYCGAEPIRAATLYEFARVFSTCGFDPRSFFPCYGMAETTLLASGGPLKRGMATVDLCAIQLRRNMLAGVETNRATVVSCGEPTVGSRFLVVNPDRHTECKPFEIGELWIAGPHVAAGYWDARLGASVPFDGWLADGRGPYLRTGDLGFLRDGDVFVTGRLKDVIIIRGRNYYPQDIEQTAQSAHPAMMGCMGAAFGVQQHNGERLVIVHEVDRSTTARQLDEIKCLIMSAVTERHGIAPYDVVLVRFGAIPRTTSGKVRRRACRDAYVEDKLNAAA